MTINTLQDVYLRLPSVYSQSSADAYRNAFERAERLTGRRLSQMPADDVAWHRIAGGIVWAGEFKRARTPQARERAFEAFVGKIAAAIRKVKEAEEAAPVVPAVASAWNRLEDYVLTVENTFDAEGRRLLPNQSSLSIANLRARVSVPPWALDTETATAALTRIPPDKIDRYRRSIRFFDGLVNERERHGAIADLLPSEPIGPLPTIRDRPMQWTLCTPEFRASIDRAVERGLRAPRKRDRFGGRLGADPVAERRRMSHGRKRPVRNKKAREKAFRSALSWLARHAFPDRAEVYDLDDLGGLFTESHVEQAMTRFIARTEASEFLKSAESTSSLSTYLSDLKTLAKRNGYGEQIIWAIEDLHDDIAEDSFALREMSATREAFVKIVDRDPEVVRAILTGPEVLAQEARRILAKPGLGAHRRTEALHLFIAAAMLAVQLARPLRTRNVHEMFSEGEMAELLPPRRERASAWLDIGKDRTKNRRTIEGKIPDWLWKIIALWIEEGRPAWLGRSGEEATGTEAEEAADTTAAQECENFYLFPAVKGSGPVSRQTINRAWNRGMARLGLSGLTPHMMRHVGATLYLARHPGDYHVVAALLADKLRTVETFYARGEGRAAMDLFAEVLEELNPTLNVAGGLR